MFRAATDDDLLDLAELERDANLAALGHEFPPERHPFPFDDVLARWRLVLEDPSATVLVHGRHGGLGLSAVVAFDDTWVRHVAVHPQVWGQGLATTGIDLALRSMARRGTAVASLWVLEENHRARRLYEHLGWAPTDERREAPWPPHPSEIRHTRPVTAAGPG
jgi:RimJ/RimL family protein N-acetyltransferase